MTDLTPTQYGFKWGGAEVTRLASNRGAVVIGINGRVEIYVSPAGQSVRVFVDGKEIR